MKDESNCLLVTLIRLVGVCRLGPYSRYWLSKAWFIWLLVVCDGFKLSI